LRIRIVSGLDQVSGKGSGSRRAKIPTKIIKNKEISWSEVLDVLFLRAEGFSCSLDVLCGGLGIHSFSAVSFFQFLVIKSLDQDLDWHSAKILDPETINPDPQHWPCAGF
jgi:hypothetical protein